MVQMLSSLPQFAMADEKLGAQGEGLPKWSGKMPPPRIGSAVPVTTNSIGASSVEGYFVELGWLGVVVKPLAPPEWFEVQKGFNATAHVFGAEIGAELDDVWAPCPSQPQLAALQRFATKHGAKWKAALADAWASGADANGPDGPHLRGLRNQLGPEWLASFKHPAIGAQPARPRMGG